MRHSRQCLKSQFKSYDDPHTHFCFPSSFHYFFRFICFLFSSRFSLHSHHISIADNCKMHCMQKKCIIKYAHIFKMHIEKYYAMSRAFHLYHFDSSASLYAYPATTQQCSTCHSSSIAWNKKKTKSRTSTDAKGKVIFRCEFSIESMELFFFRNFVVVVAVFAIISEWWNMKFIILRLIVNLDDDVQSTA